ncbi:hypothetical protein GVO57_11190 [Sphingomonas changnyeongensis]|uniref:Uncharacterized protein n=2 Tax=Sphingomonas changnyeongensis TaxID=2698679 RepID=A0A7Z2NY25_9SPHN|nr:hypothetical protein GVO57_11190 [Sphingomonas changnyeongensis]
MAAAVPLAACASDDQRAAARAAAEAAAQLSADGQGYADGARFAGPARNCVPINDLRQSRVRSDRVIDWSGGSGRTYRTVLPQSCPTLGFEQRFAYQTSLTQLCAQDIITVLQGPSAQPGPACALAPFQPITPPPRAGLR